MTDRTVRVRLEAVTAGYQARLASASLATKKFGSEAAAASMKHREAFTTMGLAAGAAGVAIGGGLLMSAKAAMDFESSFAGVRKTVDASEGQFARMASDLRELAPELGVNVNELNAIAEEAGQLGIARPNIVAFTETIAKLRETTDLVDAAPLARLMNIMQTDQSKVDQLGSAIVALGNDGASTESQIVDMAQGIAGAGNIVGLTEANVLSFANAISSVGIESEAGGTAISRVMLDMGEAVDTGGDKLDGFAKVAGMSASEFQVAFEQDAAGAIATFVGGLANLNEAGGNVTGTLRELGLSDARVRKTLLGLAGAGDLLTESLELGNEAYRDNNDLNEEFAKRMETARKKVDVAKAQLNDLAITIGSILLPVIGAIAEAVTKAFGWMADVIDKLPEPIQAVVVALTGLLGVASLLGGATLLMLPRLMDVKKALEGTALAAKLATTRVAALRLAMLSMPWVLFAAGATVAYLGLKKLGEETARTTGQIDGFNHMVGGEMTERGTRRLAQHTEWTERLKAATADLNLTYSQSQDIRTRLQDVLQKEMGITDINTASQEEFGKALKRVIADYAELHPEIEKTAKGSELFEEATKKAKRSVLDFAGSRKEMKAWREGTVLSLGSASRHFEKLRDKGNLTANDIASVFEDMLEAQRGFRKNWRTVADVWGKDTDDIAKFVSEKMGVDVPMAMNILADADRKTLKGIKEDYRDWKKEAQRTATAIGGDFDRIGGKARGAADDVRSFGTQLHNLPSSVDVDMKVTGQQIGDGPGRVSGGTAVGWANSAIGAVAGPQYITNTYRSPAHNAAVGGSPTSYHMDASNPAADIGGSNLAAIYSYLTRFPVRELIDEGDHIHVADEGGWYRGPGVVRMGAGYETFAGGLQPAQKVPDIVEPRPVHHGGRGPSGSKETMTAAFADALRSGPFKVTGRLRLSDGSFADLDGELAQDSRRQSRIRRAQGVA